MSCAPERKPGHMVSLSVGFSDIPQQFIDSYF